MQRVPCGFFVSRTYYYDSQWYHYQPIKARGSRYRVEILNEILDSHGIFHVSFSTLESCEPVAREFLNAFGELIFEKKHVQWSPSKSVTS